MTAPPSSRCANNWAQSAVLWNMALDEHAGPRCHGGACCTDCRGVVTVPRNATSVEDVTKNVEFYSLAHFSAFVPAGAATGLARGDSRLHESCAGDMDHSTNDSCGMNAKIAVDT